MVWRWLGVKRPSYVFSHFIRLDLIMADTVETAAPTPLEGEALKKRYEELKAAGTAANKIAIECGYVSAGGKANGAALNQALLVAHGLAAPAKKSGAGGGGLRGRAPGFRVTAAAKGQIVLAGSYGAMIGVEPGGEVLIVHSGRYLILHEPGVPAPVVVAAGVAVEEGEGDAVGGFEPADGTEKDIPVNEEEEIDEFNDEDEVEEEVEEED
jgi:hypothetical protein